jgi:hypothetical protein
MAVLMLLVSTSLLAEPNIHACEHANSNASFYNDCDTQVTAVVKVAVPEPSTLILMGLGLAAITLVRARKRNI